jgi:hypothetical protein
VRRRRVVTGSQRRQAHIEWLKLIEVTGPFLSVPVLTAEWPDLEPFSPSERDSLRLAHRVWQEDPVAGRDAWISFVLRDLLGWGDALHTSTTISLDIPEHETTLSPTLTLNDPATGTPVLLGLVTDGSPVARVPGSDWPATPADRLALLLRSSGVELGLATDGRWWALVWAPAGGVTTVAVFDSVSWNDAAERLVVRAFLSLLQRRRFFGVEVPCRLPALLRESLKHQEDITDALGVQVRQAVEMLVAAFSRSSLPSSVTAQAAYRGAVAVMMRLVFLLFAEESGLLPADNALYASSYSVGGLYSALEDRVADAGGNEGELDHTYLAWHRLLALFNVVYYGVTHPSLSLIAYDGSLFDPASVSWFPLTVDDRTVLHMLRSVQTVLLSGERRTVSFRTLTVEQIGYVYEGLLSFEGFRAVDVVVGLIGKAGREEEVSLSDLEAIGPSPSALAAAYKDSGIGSERALTVKLTPLTGEDLAQAESRLYAVTQDHALVQRLLPFYGIIRRDLRDDPVVILPGQLYVTESSLRSSTGTHYTPRFLAEQVAEGALEPLVYSPGPLQTADRSLWRLRSADEILSLRVADIAMGSGAFLVAACRYLAGKLIEAWAASGNVDAIARVSALPTESGLELDFAVDPVVVEARRQIIEHCLYGVDINSMAVEMAKLSLWLVSMDPSRPFTFLDDKLACGDSLLGITSVEQLEWMHLSPADGRRLHEDSAFDWTSGVRSVLGDAISERAQIVALPDDSIDEINKKRVLLADVESKTAELRRYADLVTGAALAGGSKGRWLEAAKLAGDSAESRDLAPAIEKAKSWLATDQPDGAFNREPLHWPLVFPEVFSGKDPGFDAVIGNPPFLGGTKITGPLGVAYREFLIANIANGVRAGGRSDLIAYFLLRAHALLNQGGQTGLIATNTLAQGDTREVGLDQVVASGTEIRQAVKSRPWPSKSAVLEYAAVWTSHASIDQSSERVADGAVVTRIAPSLDPASRVVDNPEHLAANAGVSFEGSKLDGIGFTMDLERAREMMADDPRNKDVLFPYLNGQDLNSRPDCSAKRWVVNFRDWSEEKASRYTAPYKHVEQLVKPERQRHSEQRTRENWWRYQRPRPEMLRAIAALDRVVVITLVSKVVMPVMVPTGQVFSHMLGVFASDDTGMLALLSSAPHYWWTIERASTLETRIRYTPSDVFETLPLPETTGEMRQLGDRLDTFRRELMLTRNAGLTATYNLVHDHGCQDAGIEELREIHRLTDEAVVRAYGWGDLLAAGLGHGFHDTRQGPRYTTAPAVKQEILDRLLELNHARYAEEVNAGLHVKRAKKTLANDGGALF